MKRTFLVGFEMTFEIEEAAMIDNGMEEELEHEKNELKNLTAKDVQDAVNAGMRDDAYNFFGESMSMMGLMTPKAKVIDKP